MVIHFHRLDSGNPIAWWFIVVLFINSIERYEIFLRSMGKLLKSIGLVSGVVILIPPLRHHFDQKIFKHVRNYNTTLNQRNKFNTEEEFHEFLGNLGHGLVTFFDTKY
jgi:hypothetical protein